MNTINIVKLPIEQLHIDKRTFVTINNDSRSLKKLVTDEKLVGCLQNTENTNLISVQHFATLKS